MRAHDLSGRRFGMLVAIKRGPRVQTGVHVKWFCVCDCGTLKSVDSNALLLGSTVSCGCKRARGNHRTHEKSRTPAYRSWASMMSRCFNPKSFGYRKWGGRGITVCKRWWRFESFLADMGERPKGLTLDRKRVNGNYKPSNCRWATKKQQARNTRVNRHISFRGERLTVAEWAERTGIARDTLAARIELGWSVHRALTSPLDARKSHSQRRKAA